MGLAGKDGGLREDGGGAGGLYCWLLGPIAKKDMSCLLIIQVHAGDNHLILSSSPIWSIVILGHRTDTLTQTLVQLICLILMDITDIQHNLDDNTNSVLKEIFDKKFSVIVHGKKGSFNFV